MKACFDDVSLQPIEKENAQFECIVFGETWEDIPDELIDVTYDNVSALNFDGGYTAFFYDKKEKKSIVFQGCIDLFSMFYTVKDDVIYFSDNWYSLLKYIDEEGCTWNLNAITDYYDNTWNNIVKYDRSPINEIMRMDVGKYIIMSDSNNGYEIKDWFNLNRTNKYIYYKDSLDDFKKEFFSVLDYYLDKCHSKYDSVCLTTSGGLDCNTITAEYCKLFPGSRKRIFTSKINGEKDESELALKMQDVVDEKIEVIPISMENDAFLDRLEMYIKKNLPPRYFNELSEDEICHMLKDSGFNNVLSGMGAENIFGFFDNEYYYLVRDLFDSYEFSKAYDVFMAAKVSYKGMREADIDHHFIRFLNSYFEKKKKGIKPEKSVFDNPYVNVKLPESGSLNIRSWNDAVAFASYSGELKAMWYDYERNGMNIVFPFAGYKFIELGIKCDPHIFADKVNKSCLRYSVKGLLPECIANNAKKMSNPGQDYREIVFKKENYDFIIDFIDKCDSTIINKENLLKPVKSGIFGHHEFLSLSLMMFEMIVKRDYGRKINVYQH